MKGSDYIEMEENKEPEMELKLCPFCGEGDFHHINNDGIVWPSIACDSCGSEVWGDDVDDAKFHWNTRPIEDELNARIKELEHVMGLDQTAWKIDA
jgi:hypothetical protein